MTLWAWDPRCIVAGGRFLFSTRFGLAPFGGISEWCPAAAGVTVSKRG